MYTEKATKEQVLVTVARAAGIIGDTPNPSTQDWEKLASAVDTVEAVGGRPPFHFPLRGIAVRGYRFGGESEMVAAFERFREDALGHQLVLNEGELRGVSLEDYLPSLRAIPPGDERRIPQDIGGYKHPVCPTEGASGTVVHTTCTGGTTFILLGRGRVEGVANHPCFLVILRHLDGFDARFSVLGEPEIELALTEEGEWIETEEWVRPG